MALEEADRLKICEILSITPLALDAQIIYLGPRLTAAIETAIAAKLTRWVTAGAKFSDITPTNSNNGFRKMADTEKVAIRNAIAGWLELTDVTSFSDTFEIERG